jgi:hypothetical protein
MKRKLAQKDCVLCLRGEDIVFVDTSQFEYLKTCQDTDRSVAVCLGAHAETNDSFLHHPIPCEMPDPDNFVEFVMGKKCLPNTDFVQYKQVLGLSRCKSRCDEQTQILRCCKC